MATLVTSESACVVGTYFATSNTSAHERTDEHRRRRNEILRP